MDFEDFFKTRNGHGINERLSAFSRTLPDITLMIIFNTMSEWVESEFERKTKKDADDD